MVVVDLSSLYSGGAILGDRIWMMDYVTDFDVFICSFVIRGQLGGLLRFTDDVVNIFDVMGY